MRRTVERIDTENGGIDIERLETELAVEQIEHGPDKKALCNACPNFNRNLACPPFSPVFADYIAPARMARVICLRLPLSQFQEHSAEERARAAFRLGSDRLAGLLLEARAQGYTVAGSGECRGCDTCAAAAGDPTCIQPERRIYSLESMGVQVAALVRTALGIDLEWVAGGRTARTISAVGAVFY
jgi:predicted metal-binding protein